jgi:hypothetical protein
MNSGKQKSPGWRDAFKRRTPAQFRAKRAVADAATARRDCDRLGLWRACPRLRCRRAECCGGEPLECRERSRAAVAQHRHAAPPAFDPAAERAARERAAAPVMSAAEAAAAIAASIAAEPPEPLPGEELEPVFCEGGLKYLPRNRVRAPTRPHDSGERDHT